MAIKIAVYKVPLKPTSENGANELNDFIEHKGKSRTIVIVTITLLRFTNSAGKNMLANDVNVSPIRIEYAKAPNTHFAVTLAPIIL